MNNLIELRDGFYWPKKDINCWKYTNDRIDVPEKTSRYAKKYDVCVQAGGNCGLYVREYAEIFKHVYTFEPDYLNFQCLSLNVPENVYSFRSFLGDEDTVYGLQMSSDIGGHNLGLNPSEGGIPMIKLDHLGLKQCDLIALDVEGCEVKVIKGAINTINKFKPTIATEMAWSDSSGILTSLGYKKVDFIDGDAIFVYDLQ